MHGGNFLRGDNSLITILWFWQCSDIACLILCWEFNSTWSSHWIRLGTWLETQLRSLKASMFNSSLCSFCYLPKLLEKSLFYFRGNFVLRAVSTSLESCSFLLQTSLLLGAMSNVGYDSLGRRNLWVLCTLISLVLKALGLHLSITLFRGRLCPFPVLTGLWKEEFTQISCPEYSESSFMFGLCLQLVVLQLSHRSLKCNGLPWTVSWWWWWWWCL